MSFRSDKSLSTVASLSIEREPIARLIYVLDQLIGSQNIIRLAQVMAKYDSLETSTIDANESNSNTNITSNININTNANIVADSSSSSNNNNNKSQVGTCLTLRPLDLEKISHRRLALALLKFLQDSIEHTIDELIRRDSRLYRSNVQISGQRSIDLTPNSRLAFGLRKSETSSILETSSSNKMRIDLNLIGAPTSQNRPAPSTRRQPSSSADQLLSSCKQMDDGEDPIERTLNYIKGLDVKLAPDCKLKRRSNQQPHHLVACSDAIQANQIQLHWSGNNHRAADNSMDAELSPSPSPSPSASSSPSPSSMLLLPKSNSPPIETRIHVSSANKPGELATASEAIATPQNTKRTSSDTSGRQQLSSVSATATAASSSPSSSQHLGASIERRTILRPGERSKSVTDSKQIDVSNIKLIREETELDKTVQLDTGCAVGVGHNLGSSSRSLERPKEASFFKGRQQSNDESFKRHADTRFSSAPNSSGVCCSESHYCCCCTRKRRIQRHKQRQHSNRHRSAPATGSGSGGQPSNEVREKSVCLECERAYG